MEEKTVTNLTQKVFNEQVNSMLGEVSRAKVRLSRKLITDANKLTAKKVEDINKKEKNLRKVSRLQTELHTLRHLKLRKIAKFVLSQNEESVEALRANPNSTDELRVLAKISLNKLIKTVVDNFHNKYSDWQQILPTLIKSKKKLKKSKKKKLQQDPKPHNNKNDDGACVKVDFTGESLDKVGDQSENSSNFESGVEIEEDQETEIDEDGVDEDEVDEKELEEEVEEQKEQEEGRNSLSEKPQKGLLLNLISSKKQNPPSKFKAEKESEFSFKKSEKISEISQREGLILDDIKKSDGEVQMNVDPFFLTNDNKNYLTYCKVEPVLDKPKELSVSRMANQSYLDLSINPKQPIFDEKLLSRGKFSKAIRNNERPSHRFGDDGTFYKTNLRFEKNTRKMSWHGLDKKMNKSNSSEYITPNKVTETNRMTEEFEGKNTPKGIKKNNTELHPSWEAKKRTSVMLPFEGKKIIFDD